MTRKGPASKSQTPQFITCYEGSYNELPFVAERPDGYYVVGTYTRAQTTPGRPALELARLQLTRKFFTVIIVLGPERLSIPCLTISAATYVDPVIWLKSS